MLKLYTVKKSLWIKNTLYKENDRLTLTTRQAESLVYSGYLELTKVEVEQLGAQVNPSVISPVLQGITDKEQDKEALKPVLDNDGNAVLNPDGTPKLERKVKSK